jgi:nitrogen regulatory protein P-II 1
MKQIVAIVQPHRIDDVKEKLRDIGVTGMTVSEVRGAGRQKGHKETFRGSEYQVEFIPKIKVEVVVTDEKAEECVTSMVDAAYTGRIGDGKVFISNVEDVVRIRTKERGESAL